MPNSDTKEFEKRLSILNAKKEAIFERINRIFKHSLNLNISSIDLKSNENFMMESETVEDLRSKFEVIVDQINDLMLTHDTSAIPDYKPLLAFEDLYSRIKRIRNNISSMKDDTSSQVRYTNKIKLPPIEIPSFDGSMESWPVFYESFKANIHNNVQLTDSQRVQYLVGKLTHNALKVTAGIVPTGDTYNILWNSLVKKYQDKRALGTYYLNNILDIKACINNASSLDSFIEKYSASVAALKQLGITDLADFIFVHCALRKIDAQTVQAFELTVRNQELPSYKDLIAFVQDQAKILGRSYNNNLRPSNASNKQILTPGPSTRTFSTKSFIISNNNCIYCDQCDHTQLNRCLRFKDLGSPQMRYDFIKSKHGCVNCLSSLHTASKCDSPSVCELCSKRHHTLLHFDINTISSTHTSHAHTTPILSSRCSQRSPSSSVYAAVGNAQDCVSCTSRDSNSQPRAESRNEQAVGALHESIPATGNDERSMLRESTSLSCSVELQPNSSVLLSTAQVYAMSDTDSNMKIIRCLLDNGSQNHLITVGCCKLLNLVIVPLKNSYLKGIGMSSRPIYGYVNLKIQSRVDANNTYNIQAVVVDCITDKLPSHFIDKCNMSYLENLPLADLTWNIPGNIDLVLGAQLFPYIYMGNMVKSNTNGPPAVSTAFGYVLMGGPHVAIPSSFSALALNECYSGPEDTKGDNSDITSLTRDNGGFTQELIKSLKLGAFNLIKWTGNATAILECLPDTRRSPLNITDVSGTPKVLGLAREPEDVFLSNATSAPEQCTKQSRISVIGRLFDVMGLVALIILYAKLFIKELWLCNIGWDETPLDSVVRRFYTLVQELPTLSTLKGRRHVFGVYTVNLASFCDAGILEYGCVTYLHTTGQSGVTVRMLRAKSKVSPTIIMTLARLELCAVPLMSKLLKYVQETYRDRVPSIGIYAFSDSSIALSWIHPLPHQWSVFVSDRIVQVRHKSTKLEDPFEIETVLVEQDDCPPLTWPLGVITHVFSDSDRVIRLAMEKTSNKSFKRLIVKFCPTPSQ